MKPTFIHQSNDRVLPADYSGDILLFDIDKTYLDTHFSSFRGLLRIPLELAIDKRALPGVVPLIRALRRGLGERSAIVPLYFVSGSPIQMRTVIENKMTLDGVQYDGITFKDQFGLLRARRPKDIKRQVGYKLKALLSYYQDLPKGARWLMFGDDVESDAEAFLLFGEVCHHLRDKALAARLRMYETHPKDIQEVLALSQNLDRGDDPVEGVFIHLTKGRDPTEFTDPRVVPCHSYLQTVLALAERGKVKPEAVGSVAKALRRERVPEDTIVKQLRDAETRLRISKPLIDRARAS